MTIKLRKVSGAALKGKAKSIYLCDDCNIKFQSKVASCSFCAGSKIIRFDSSGEATKWVLLKGFQKLGLISDLQRQIKFELNAYNGCESIHVCDYVSDFTYWDDGKFIVADYKGETCTDIAAMKHKWMAAQGTPVTILTQGNDYR